MKIARQIKIQKTEETTPNAGPQWIEPRGLVSAVHAELRPGYFVHVALGSAGLQIWRGDQRVGIPFSTLMEIAAELNPEAFGTVTEAPREIARSKAMPRPSR